MTVKFGGLPPAKAAGVDASGDVQSLLRSCRGTRVRLLWRHPATPPLVADAEVEGEVLMLEDRPLYLPSRSNK